MEQNCRLNQLLRSCLTEAGYKVMAADSGLAAVALASCNSRDHIDVLLAQPHASAMSGLHLARWMHQFHPQLKYLELADSLPSAEAFPCGTVPMPIQEKSLLSGLSALLSSPSRAA
jgi:CheY-like chemotaxis protein